MIFDHLGLEAMLVKHLAQSVLEVGDCRVLTASGIDNMLEEQQHTPAIYVIYHDETPVTDAAGNSARGKQQLVDQLWMVIIVVRNVSDTSGTANREDCGPYITKVLASLQNWDPGHPYMRMNRVKAAYRATYRQGFLYFPLMFSTRLSIKGNRNVT